MLKSQALAGLFDTADVALKVLFVALEGVDSSSRVLDVADELAALRRELATQGLVQDEWFVKDE